MTREEILAILDSGEFSGLVGEREDQELEFKQAPYRLDDRRQCFELAKDVSALSNARGGLLLIGFATERQADSPLETVASVRPFERRLANEQRCVEKLRQLLYPSVQGLRVEFKPTADEDQRGVMVIDVPAQAERDKYFLIAESFAAEEHLPGWVFGVAIRSVDRVEALRIGQLHALVSDGLNVVARLNEIASLVGEGPAANPPQQNAAAGRVAERVNERVAGLQRLLDEAGEA